MALKAAPAEQALLLDLQALDTKLQQVGHRLAKLPEAVLLAELTGGREALQRTATEHDGALEDARIELGRVESDVAVVEARIARDNERMQGSASMKDVQALEQELAALARRKSDLEDIELAVMETVEERETIAHGTRTEIEELDSSIAAATSARDAALRLLDADREEAERLRAAIAGKVSADLLALYEKQRARYGVGASHLRGGISTASGVALNASDLNTVRAAAEDDVLLCSDSNAILVRTAESGL